MLQDHRLLKKILTETLDALPDILIAELENPKSDRIPEGSEKAFSATFEGVLKNAGLEKADRKACSSRKPSRLPAGFHGFTTELRNSVVDAPVTYEGRGSGKIDIVEVLGPTNSNEDRHDETKYLSAIELKVMPLPSGKIHGDGPDLYYLWQVCKDHARIQFAEGFEEECRGWVVILLYGPWVRRIRKSGKIEDQLKRVFHDAMFVDFQRAMDTGELRDFNNRRTYGYPIASAHTLMFDRPFTKEASTDEEFLMVVDEDRSLAIAALAADPTHRW